MTYDTMTGWIEIADGRRFVETANAERLARPNERHHLHLGTAIFSLPCRIIDAVTHRHSSDAC